MVARPSRRRRRHPYKSQAGKRQFVAEDLDHPNRVLLADIIFQAVRQQRPLHPIFAVDEPMHLHTPEASSFGILKQIRSERNPAATKSQAVFTRARPSTAIAGRPSNSEVGRIRWCIAAAAA